MVLVVVREAATLTSTVYEIRLAVTAKLVIFTCVFMEKFLTEDVMELSMQVATK